ncbi:RNA polymerase II transcription mediator complex subunit 9-domain-containing protein [Massariosphaeria phaeospora]|uniref:Mediator of RNA polymerase II transcription subunit 9 n=1 Tax=Massariosphaeria phaeospora TaxID=100035 RepID=A0A7C8IBA3_9PLEO|nr:RNA polymerase II transcription mediator complex subunit 9-domain-containing protein [Massariosphaeria phaeospora]
MSAAATPHTSILPAGDAAPAPPGMPTAAPAPATFDILPDLHKLLSRLISTSPQHPAPTPAPTPGQPVGDGPLEMQHLATAATDVKLKIQKARRAVMALPDIGRTLEDQQEEIEDLQARIARLKASLRELGQPPGESEDGDQSMTG